MTLKALVTGGTRGIGQAVSQLFLEQGFDVTVTGVSPGGQGPNGTRYLSCDFADLRKTEAFAKEIAGMGYSILINNAGINKIGNLSEYPLNDFEKIQRVNVTAPFILCKSVIPHMQAQGFGRIINITSVYGFVSRAGRSAYSTSKFGLYGLSRALALEVAKDNILVNCVSPGFVDTELTHKILGEKGMEEIKGKIPMGRFAKPQEIAKFIVFLSSEENTYMTGQNVIVDGGFTCE